MPSPFPGVDPSLESQGLWPDFHAEFISCWRQRLLDHLPREYDARMDERVYLTELPEGPSKLVLPDVAIEETFAPRRGSLSGQAVATLEPMTIPLCTAVETRELFIRILHREDRSVVAVLEVLSPANKSSASRGVYLEKRADVIASPVHLVELDLLLGGERLPMARPLPPAHYYALVSRGDQRPNSNVYRWTVRDRLPSIPIPLKPPHPDLIVDLAEVFTTAFQRGRYERAIDDAADPRVELSPDDRAWTAARARKAIEPAPRS